ncbi:RNA ligase [Vibrio phage K567]
MKLSTFLEGQGTYVGIKLDESSKQELVRLQTSLRLANPLDPDKFHVTVLYSRNQIDVPAVDTTFVATIEYIDCWKTQDGKHAVVAKMKCPELVARHEDLISIGGTHDYPDYTPHVTLSYDDAITPLFVEAEVRLVDEYVEPLDLSWAENNG